jgi:TRAP-type C4-dicarboxylate transport system permease small subunit
MIRLVDGYFRLLKGIVVLCLATMVVLVFGNVVLRYGFNSGITISEELSRWCFVWLTFTGAIIAMRFHTHLGMESVVSRLPVLGKKICYVLSHAIMIACVVLFFTGSWEQTVINLGNAAPATGLSSGFYYGTGLYFSVSAFGILVYDLYTMLSGKLKDNELVQIKESQEELDSDKLDEYQHEMEREMQKSDPSSANAKK